VAHEETGLRVAEGDRAQLAAALGALALDAERRRVLGAAARRRAAAELTWDAVAQRYRDAYRWALTRA
jgi:glycosyltransferase involved in cell wall biosynthesis